MSLDWLRTAFHHRCTCKKGRCLFHNYPKKGPLK